MRIGIARTNGSRPPLPIGEKEASNRYSYSTESSHTMAGRTPLVNDVETRISFLICAVKWPMKIYCGEARLYLLWRVGESGKIPAKE